MNLKSTIVSGLFAATVLVGGIASTGSAFAQSNDPSLYHSCIARAPISQVQRQLTHAKSANANNRCLVPDSQASISSQFPSRSLASSGNSN
jgi:hypothetical protein